MMVNRAFLQHHLGSPDEYTVLQSVQAEPRYNAANRWCTTHNAEAVVVTVNRVVLQYSALCSASQQLLTPGGQASDL